MESTDLRQAFFAEVHRDPWAHQMAEVWARAWIQGYQECAAELRRAEQDGVVVEDPLSIPFEELRQRALEFLTEDKRHGEAAYLLAMAAMAPLVHARTTPALCTCPPYGRAAWCKIHGDAVGLSPA